METTVNEKRKYLRTELTSRVDLADSTRVQAINISEGGIGITSSHPYTAGTILFIIIPLCDQKIEKGLIKVIAEIKWSKPKEKGEFEIGLEFFCINEFDKAKVNGYIAEKLKTNS
jgi:c-di-GMP-binding flagellar brake protein YcgR